MRAFVLPRSLGGGPHDRVDPDHDPAVPAPVVATFRHAGTRWHVDGDTALEPLLLAWHEVEGRGGEPFGFRETKLSWALALRPDLYDQLTLPGDRGAGRLFVRAPKRMPAPALPQVPSLTLRRGAASPSTGSSGPTPFDPDAAPRSATPVAQPDSAMRAALLEKAVHGHHQILVRLFGHLTRTGWSDIGEFPLAIDLWARDPAGRRVIFEAKTISETNAVAQCRRGLAQLLEYRLLLGDREDLLCLITDVPVASTRASVLERLGVAVLASTEAGVLIPGGDLGADIGAALTTRSASVRGKGNATSGRLDL